MRRPAKPWSGEAIDQRHQPCVRDDDRQQEHQPGQQSRDDEPYVQELMAHDGYGHGDRDERDGEQHFDGRVGDQAPGQQHDQGDQHSEQQPEELAALDV